MLELKNILEDIVYELIDNTDEAKGGVLSKNQKKEIAAYVLNRVKPMYTTSNKGFANVIFQYQNNPQLLADLMVYISVAIKIVQKAKSPKSVGAEFDPDKLYYVFPKIYGKIISSRDFMPIQTAEISLLINSVIAKSYFSTWRNPITLFAKDEGIFSFAPCPIEANQPYEKKNFVIKISITVDGKTYEKSLAHEITPALLENIEADFHENIIQLEDIYVPSIAVQK